MVSRGRPGLGAIPRRTLGLRALLWMDMGFLRTLGLGAVSLWTLVRLWRELGLVAGPGLCRIRTDLGPGLRVLLWVWRWRLGIEPRVRIRGRFRKCGLAALRPRRPVLPLVRPGRGS